MLTAIKNKNFNKKISDTTFANEGLEERELMDTTEKIESEAVAGPETANQNSQRQEEVPKSEEEGSTFNSIIDPITMHESERNDNAETTLADDTEDSPAKARSDESAEMNPSTSGSRIQESDSMLANLK